MIYINLPSQMWPENHGEYAKIEKMGENRYRIKFHQKLTLCSVQIMNVLRIKYFAWNIHRIHDAKTLE